MMKINLSKIDVGTIVRTGAAFIALINQIFAITGLQQIPFDDQAVYQWLSMGATVITFAINWWKNNSFTKEAQLGDQVKKAAKEDIVVANKIEKMLKENEEAAQAAVRKAA
ncbi:phage holin [Eubacterium limosum]|nr:phage holin [Eubacterium limosum]